MLSQVTQRLEEMAGYLTQSGQAARSGFDDTATFNDTVMSQVRELSAEAVGATDLSVLQSLVSSRLETVTRQVLEFRAREEARLQEQAGRTERMHAHIADLEREAQELQSRLDREKHGARLDPLTRVANRKSFDERFAEEVLHRSLGDLPVAMLLWDIDDFKTINDSYGHRAGDRVLQTVAQCFVSQLRTEDFVARIGGEEFVVLMTGLAPASALRNRGRIARGGRSAAISFPRHAGSRHRLVRAHGSAAQRRPRGGLRPCGRGALSRKARRQEPLHRRLNLGRGPAAGAAPRPGFHRS